MRGRSVIFPDALLNNESRRRIFYLPKFFDACQLFFDSPGSDFARLTMVVGQKTLLLVGFFKDDKIKVCRDGSVIYNCYYTVIDGPLDPPPSGRWRRSDDQVQLRVFHHTNDQGYQGITSSQSLWSSQVNLQGNLRLKNIGYGYFTVLPKIRSDFDLMEIAMSSSGLAGLIRTNAPMAAENVLTVDIPKQSKHDRPHALTCWVNWEWISPNHLWRHVPLSEPAYYEIIHSKIVRVGVIPGATFSRTEESIAINDADLKSFSYVVVGDADTANGLKAPYNEEETGDIALIEKIKTSEDIISFWRSNANTDLFSSGVIEYASFAEPITSSIKNVKLAAK
ncbi:MAG TPA: hypothetical protein VF194_07630 [Ferrovibrio sp.]|uniref:hypothetical protein n=1 Tax=Ferrovibrio sp. TaxID=1917215 RepID=UPI002ED58487